MTIRGKVLLLLTVAVGLVVLMGGAIHQGSSQARLLRSWESSGYEQRYLISQLRGEALVLLDELQRVHGSGANTEAVLNQYRRRMVAHLSRLRELADAQERWSGMSREEERRHIDRVDRALIRWAERAEERVRGLPTLIGSDGAHPQVTINEFGRSVEPLLAAGLEIEAAELKQLSLRVDEGLRLSGLLSATVPMASLGVLLALALTILVPMNRRLRELVAGAERIGGGELRASLPEKGSDELGSLARAFNRMAQELATSQARLIHADRMASLGRTVASVGHEINNPLTYVVTNLSYVREELSQSRSGLSEEGRQGLLEALDDARKGAERVRFIAQDLRSLSRPDDASLGLVDVAQVVRDVARMASHELEGRARLMEDCAGVPQVRANAMRLGQVFLNLIVNAAQAIPPGNVAQNEIRVTARHLTPDRIAVDVSDTGCGIPPENLERIFDPFFTTKPEGEGTGLGLAVCRNIIQSLGGSITVDSTPGKGTTFHITLPTASSDSPTAPAA
jgi:signal transduction histidine kinase